MGLPLPFVGDEAAVGSGKEREIGRDLPMNVQRFLFGPVDDRESDVSLGFAESAVSSFVRLVVREEFRL